MTTTRQTEIDLVAGLLADPQRIDRILRRDSDGNLYSTDAERYIDQDGRQHDGGAHVKVPQCREQMDDDQLREEAEAILDQLAADEYPYHVEVHTRRPGCHLEDYCDDYRTLEDAEEAAQEMSREFRHSRDYYCQVMLAGDIVAQKDCADWCEDE